MTDLLPEEKAALIAALENDGNLFTSRTDKEPGPSLLWEYGGKGSWDLTPAGQIVATLLKKESEGEALRNVLGAVKYQAEKLGKKTHAGCDERYMKGRDDAIRSMLHVLDGDPVHPGAFIAGKRGTEYQLRLEARVMELEAKESRLERAKAKLKEWAKRADTTGFEWTSWTISETNQQHTPPFCAVLTWWDQEPKSWQQHHADPLTAVIEASKRTPWPLEE